MNNLSRRSLLRTTSRLAIGAAMAVPLAACATGGGTVATIPVTLTTAQQEASGILTAFNEYFSLMGEPSVAEQTALGVAGTAVSAFTVIKPGQTYLQAAEAVVGALTPLLAFLPVAGPTIIAIKAGIGLVEALIAGETAVAAPAPVASPAVGAAPMKVIPAPIPIPVPVA